LSTVMKLRVSSERLHGSRVELVAHTVDGDVPEVEHRGADEKNAEANSVGRQ